jgi:hypothetical protein
MDDRKNSFAFFQREGNFVHHIGGLDAIGRENHQQLGTRCQGVLDGTVSTLTGLDVESVDPHGGPARPQVFGKAKRELGVFMSVAKESKLKWRLHGDKALLTLVAT